MMIQSIAAFNYDYFLYYAYKIMLNCKYPIV